MPKTSVDGRSGLNGIQIKESVIAFICTQVGISPEKITTDAKIESDFGMAGLDTLEFYEAFFREFEIQNPLDFDVDRYVTPDTFSPGLMVRSLFSRSAKEKLKILPVSVGHLVKVAEEKYWREEDL